MLYRRAIVLIKIKRGTAWGWYLRIVWNVPFPPAFYEYELSGKRVQEEGIAVRARRQDCYRC
jgi:hypothetical protein